jgi:hypothetical protein
MPTKKEQAMQFLQPAAQSVGYDDIVRSAVKIAENTSSKPAAQSVSQIEGGVINQNILQAKSNENEATSTSEIADSNLSDFERWQKDNPGAGAYEYAYIKTAKAPKDPDANKANKRNRLAGFADLAMLLSDGITAVAGGNVNRRTTSATAVNNEALEAIRERARQLRETYDTGLTKARYQDLADKTKRQDYLTRLADEKAILADKYANELALLKERQVFERDKLKTASEEKQRTAEEERKFKASEAEKNRKALDARAAANRTSMETRAAAKKSTTKEDSQEVFATYNALKALYDTQREEYNKARKGNKKAVITDYVTLPPPPVNPSKADIETYVGLNRKHIKQQNAGHKDPLGLGITTNGKKKDPLNLGI